MGVTEQFSVFCGNLTINNRSVISDRYKAITRRLNIEFWDSDDDTMFSRYVGSYGRGTAIRGFSDLDMLFILPDGFYGQYDNYVGNGQSALLQRVRNAIAKTYPGTNIGADGQVVVVSFSDGMRFEVVPVFNKAGGGYTYPDSNAGGSWKFTNPIPEITAVAQLDKATNGNLKGLCRMARAWKNKWDVPMGGLLVDTLAYRFLENWAYRTNSYVYYDWMSRDFFNYLAKQDPEKSYWQAVGSGQFIWRRGKFEFRAKSCAGMAVEAIQLQSDGYDWSSKQQWREIYGSAFPS